MRGEGGNPRDLQLARAASKGHTAAFMRNNSATTDIKKPGLPVTRDLKRSSKTSLNEGRYWDANGPQVALRLRDGKPKGTGHIESPEYHFADHAYREKGADGRMQYKAEPYSLNGHDFSDLAWLVANGWDVSVSNSGRHANSTLLVNVVRA